MENNESLIYNTLLQWRSNSNEVNNTESDFVCLMILEFYKIFMVI